ncbi:MAG: 5-formyltetrahydrofolate cyclo-ligase [Actinomycetota bacterium]
MTDPSWEKADLRARMRALRAAVPLEERLRLAVAVEERVFALPVMAPARTVLLFYSFGSEVETSEMAKRVHQEGKRLLLPFLEAERMEAAEVLPEDELVPSGYGPREPARRVAVDPSEVDVVIAPGLAFDREGYRLGYGGGHYDRYLSRIGPGALRIGIGFAAQLVERVPREPADERLDLVVTDTGVVDCRSTR